MNLEKCLLRWLLPPVAEVLMSNEGTAEERLARARECLSVGGGKLLLGERT